jgi:hypothetical protein
MLKSLAAFWVACALLCAPALGLTQTYPQVLGPGGSSINPGAALIFVQACNGGLGGFVGSTYATGGECLMPGSGGGGGGSNAAAGSTGSGVPSSAGYTGFNSGGNLVGVSAANPLPVTGVASGLGAQQAIPTTGTATTPVALGAIPTGAVGVRLYAPTGTTIAFTIANSAGNAASQFAAGAFKTFSQSTDGPTWDENLTGGMNLYVGPITGAGTASSTVPAPSFRYY